MKTTKKFAVVLSGCGVYDGTEIHEAVLTLLAILKNGASYQIFAPDIEQHHVVNHLTGQETKELRNVLVESARIARGNIKPLTEYNPSEFDALVFPGGFGVAKNLCTVAFDGANAKVDPAVENAVRKTHQLKKPIGALCIAPAMIAKILGNIEVTIGNDTETIDVIVKMGGKHKETTHGQVVFDAKNNVFTTPCYMLDATILDISVGAENIIKEIMSHLK